MDILADPLEKHLLRLADPTGRLFAFTARQRCKYRFAGFRNLHPDPTVALTQHGGKEPFGLYAVREKTEGRHSGCLPLYDTPGRICRNVHRFAIVLRCKPLDRLLVLLYVERTGTVNENSARTQRLPHIAEDAPSARSAKFHIGFAPFGAGSRRFAEHPLARTRSIDQHQVEIVTQRREMRRIVVRH